jgi:hypothetical protein
MSTGERADICDFCGNGTVIRRDEKISFHQWTDRGYVFCTVTIPMHVCPVCDARFWDEAAEAIIEEAVRTEYDKRS